MTSEASPISIHGQFMKLPRLMFITINPNKGLDDNLRVCKIGKWSDYLRKISTDFIIVREKTGGYHFHALFSLKKGKKINYIKNIHFKVDAVGGEYNYCEDTTFENMCEDIASDGGNEDDLKTAYDEYKEDRKVVSKRLAIKSKNRKEDNISRILNYLFKESPRLVMVDYIHLKEAKLQMVIDPAVS